MSENKEVVAKINAFLKEEGVIIPRGPIHELYSQLLKLAGFGAGALITFSGRKAGKIAGGYIRDLVGKENPTLEEVAEYVSVFFEEAKICKSVSFDIVSEELLFFKAKGSILAEGNKSKKPVCMPLAGAIAGTFEDITGKSWECKELECQAQGKEFCIFELKAK